MCLRKVTYPPTHPDQLRPSWLFLIIKKILCRALGWGWGENIHYFSDNVEFITLWVNLRWKSWKKFCQSGYICREWVFEFTRAWKKMATFLGRTCRLHQQMSGARRYIQRHSLRFVSTSDKKESNLSIPFTPEDIADETKRKELHKRLEEHFKDEDLNSPKVSQTFTWKA